MSSPAGKSLDAADCAVFGVLTILGYAVGLYFSLVRRRSLQASSGLSREHTAAELEAFLGGRSLPAAALAVSVLASVVNGVSIVGFVGHHYAHGFHVLWNLCWVPLASLFVATGLVPLLYGMRVTSIFQQTLGAVGIYSAGIGISTMFSVPLAYSNVAIGLAGTVYTALGGLRSVVWADCIQAAVMTAAPLTMIGKVLYDSGRVVPPLKPMSEFNATEYMFRTNFDATSDENFWSCLLPTLPHILMRMGFDQMAVQRFMAARTERQAKRIAVAGAASVVSFFILQGCTGLAMVYWYRDCDPVRQGVIQSYDQIVPYYVRESLSDVTVLRGLFLAGLLGASTSTVSSVVNSHAATFYTDIVAPSIQLSEWKAVFVMRLLAFASGTIMTLYAVAIPYMGTAARLFMSFYASCSGPFTGIVLLALSSPWINAKGAAWGSLLVCVLQLWHAVGRSISGMARPPVLSGTLDRCPPINDTETEPGFTPDSTPLSQSTTNNVFLLYRMSFYWSAFLGALLTLFLGTLFSLATGGMGSCTKNLPLTSPLFIRFWKRFKFFDEKFQCQEEKRRDFRAKRAEQPCEDELVALSAPLPASNNNDELQVQGGVS
ncbi:putative sodium-dependent multivitamin transporter isoform X2 [Haemaphysalis longicornis]